MNEKELNIGLRSLAKEGWFVVKMTDELGESLLSQKYAPSSDERKDQFISRLRVRIQDSAIQNAKREIDPSIVPFGLFIECLRECAHLTRAEIASRLGKDNEFVQQIEQGVVSPLQLPTIDVADLVILFQIKIKDVARLADTSLDPPHTHQGFGSSARRLPSDVWNRDAQVDAGMGIDIDTDIVKRCRILDSLGRGHEVEAFLINLKTELVRRGQVQLLS
jgi:transcriptional regulator with XRE-family HTH domain